MKTVCYTTAKTPWKSTTRCKQKLKNSVKGLLYLLKITARITRSDSSNVMMGWRSQSARGMSFCVENAIVNKINWPSVNWSFTISQWSTSRRKKSASCETLTIQWTLNVSVRKSKSSKTSGWRKNSLKMPLIKRRIWRLHKWFKPQRCRIRASNVTRSNKAKRFKLSNWRSLSRS